MKRGKAVMDETEEEKEGTEIKKGLLREKTGRLAEG